MDYNDALELATRKHDGQYRRYTGEPYISHPIAVASNFIDQYDMFTDECDYTNTNCAIVSILHDTIEDTDLTIETLKTDYSPNDYIIDALIAITRNDGEPYLKYILRCKRNKIATEVKIEDLLHNLSDLEKGNMRDKYIMALYILGI
jgi:GTP pyrophosphokinase